MIGWLKILWWFVFRHNDDDRIGDGSPRPK
jgi:hypothetical protein